MPKTSHTIRVIKDRLIQPVGRFMRHCVTIEDFTSLHLAIEKMREAGQEIIPVTQDGKIFGVLTQNSIVKILGTDADKDSAVGDFVDPAATISNSITGAEALRHLENNNTLVVVDDHGVVCGLLTPSCFIGTPQAPEPHMVGGMATPFGVYLTTGSVRGGKSGWYLFSTGMFIMTFFGLGAFGMILATSRLPDSWQNSWQLGFLAKAMTTLFMLSIFRLLPIAGYHAAEHQVVHALERDEELTPEVVARMPRVHPRCGTNLAVAVTIFSTIWRTPWIPVEGLRLSVAVLTTLFLWKTIGSFVQYWFTTKKPNQRQIASGIEAGTQLLANYATASNRTATPLTRIINSGILHVMAGSFTTLLIIGLILRQFGIDILQL
jgi:CBS domain-containing protein